MKTLYVAWEDPEDRSWMPVGRLTVTEQGTYRFNYTKGAEMSKRFTPFVKLDELDAEYESDELFPIFRNRIVHETLALARFVPSIRRKSWDTARGTFARIFTSLSSCAVPIKW